MLLAMGLGRFSYTAMVPALIGSGKLTESDAGFVAGCNLAGFLVGALIAERLRKRWSLGVLLKGALWLSVVALVASAVDAGFLWLAVWRGVLGVTVAIMMIQGLALTLAATPEDQHMQATAVIFAGVGVGICLSGTLVPWLLEISVRTAWIGIALIGLVALVGAHWCWRYVDDGLGRNGDGALRSPVAAQISMPRQPYWGMLLVAHACFSIGLAPHTIYWVDFIARGLGQGLDVGGYYWVGAGICAIFGPIAAIFLGRWLGTAWALVLVFAVLSIGLAAPGFTDALPILLASTIIFGAQPGLSALIAARVREMGCVDAMPRLMRQMILVNGLGAAVAGLGFPALFGAFQNYAWLFWSAGAVMALGAVLSVPWPNLFAKKVTLT
jgi:predicted MFS family arabinose efflux permease